jgi:hypothetical protein
MIVDQWKEAFLRTVQHYENASSLRAAAIDERLADWTAYLTEIVVQTCDSLGWVSAAKGNKLHILPVPHSEYLTLEGPLRQIRSANRLLLPPQLR